MKSVQAVLREQTMMRKSHVEQIHMNCHTSPLEDILQENRKKIHAQSFSSQLSLLVAAVPAIPSPRLQFSDQLLPMHTAATERLVLRTASTARDMKTIIHRRVAYLTTMATT